MKLVKYGLGIVAGVTLASSLANADVMVGIDYPVSSNMTRTMDVLNKDVDIDFSYKPVAYKLGFGTAGDFYTQIYYQSDVVKYDSFIDRFNKDDFKEVGIDFIPQWNVGVKNLYANILFGIAYGWYESSFQEESSLKTVSLSGRIGAGLSYYLFSHVELLGGMYYQYRGSLSVDISDDVENEDDLYESFTDSGYNIYLGINLWWNGVN
jgi:hypothetical protein